MIIDRLMDHNLDTTGVRHSPFVTSFITTQDTDYFGSYCGLSGVPCERMSGVGHLRNQDRTTGEGRRRTIRVQLRSLTKSEWGKLGFLRMRFSSHVV